MPHYTDFSGRFAEIPVGSGEYWGSVDSTADLQAASATLDWTSYQSNSGPVILAQLENEIFWQNNQFPLPEVFAVMADSSFNGAQETHFKVWDVDWNSSGIGVPSPRAQSVSLQQLVDETSNPQKSSHGIDQVYLQVNSLPALAVPALGMPGSLGLGLALLAVAVFVSLRRRWSKNTVVTQT
jgi:hypothetical protein